METTHIVALLFIAFIFVAGIVLMPFLSGIGTYQAKSPVLEEESDDLATGSTTSHQYNGYHYKAPDEDDEGEEVAVSSNNDRGLKRRIQKLKSLTTEDIPIQLNIGVEPRVNNVNHQTSNGNPNEYDYDLDEFIEKEHALDMANRFNT